MTILFSKMQVGLVAVVLPMLVLLSCATVVASESTISTVVEPTTACAFNAVCMKEHSLAACTV